MDSNTAANTEWTSTHWAGPAMGKRYQLECQENAKIAKTYHADKTKCWHLSHSARGLALVGVLCSSVLIAGAFQGSILKAVKQGLCLWSRNGRAQCAFAMISKSLMTYPFTDTNLCFLFLTSQTSSFQTA